MLLNQAGLIEAEDVGSLRRLDWKAKNLTWAGHEFLEASRDDGLWNKAKAIMVEKGGVISFEVLKQLLIELAKGRVFG